MIDTKLTTARRLSMYKAARMNTLDTAIQRHIIKTRWPTLFSNIVIVRALWLKGLKYPSKMLNRI